MTYGAYNLLQAAMLVYVCDGLGLGCRSLDPAWSWEDSDDTDVIYVESNQTSGNSILAFRNDGVPEN